MCPSVAVIVFFSTILTAVLGLNELFEAIKQGNESAVISLLEPSSTNTLPVYTANSRDETPRLTPLKFAMERRKENIAEYLIKKGATDRPLGKAIDFGMENVAKLILEDANVDVNKEIFFPYGHKRAKTTLLHKAISKKRAVIVKMICDKGADLEKTNYCNFTPLQCAIHMEAGADIVRILLEAGADVNGVNCKLDTALHFAAENYKSKNNREIADFLLSVRGINIEAVNINGDTPLQTAAIYTNVECMRALLAAGANVHARDNRQKTILHHFMSHDNEDVINLAKSYGFDFDSRDVRGDTPFLYSAVSHDVNAMRALAKAGANVNLHNKDNKGVMHYAVEENRRSAEMVEIALFYGECWDFPSEIERSLNSLLLKRQTHRGRPALNTLLEAGLQLSGEKNMVLLKDYWPPCHEIVENGNFQNFQELFGKATEALLKNDVPKMNKNDDDNFVNLLSEYELKGAFALFKILKTIYAKKEPATDLERRKFEIFDYGVMIIMKGTYLTTLPLELTSDILHHNTYYRWKLEKMSFYLAVAFDELNISLDHLKKAILEDIFNYSKFQAMKLFFP